MELYFAEPDIGGKDADIDAMVLMGAWTITGVSPSEESEEHSTILGALFLDLFCGYITLTL